MAETPAAVTALLHDDEFHAEAVTRVMRLRIPIITLAWGWRSVFPGLQVGGEAELLVGRLHDGRERMTRALGGAMANNNTAAQQECLAALEAYLPNLLQLLSSLESQKPKQTNLTLSFTWLGSFAGSGAPYTSKFIIYEVCLVLHALGVVNYIHGVSLLALGSSNLKAASAVFLKSSSYFLNLAMTTLPRWNRDNLETKPAPCELDESTCMAASHLARAAAQQCAISVAMRTPGSKLGVLAKLCAAVVEEAEGCLLCLKSNKSSPPNPVLGVHGAFLRELFGSLAFYFQGRELCEGSMKTEKFGEGIAFFNMSVSKLSLQGSASTGGPHNPNLPGMPRTMVAPSGSIGKFLTIVGEARAAAMRDNDVIYFHTIPASCHVELLPRGFSVIAPEVPADVRGPIKFVDFHESAPIQASNPPIAPSVLQFGSASAEGDVSTHGASLLNQQQPAAAACPTCTFENPHGTPACQMCETELK